MSPEQLIDRPSQDRFLRDWKALTGSAVADRALIALSGGPDSTALALLFAAVRKSLNPPVAATVDHGLRAASSAEAGVAADLCRAVDMPHAILKGTLPDRSGPTANLSARARDLRYQLLRDHAETVDAQWIVTAHHADDQLETVIMRLNRGSGVGGLAGIRPRADHIVRPLLGWTRAELARLVTSAGVCTVDDPSNVDARFDRARLRQQLAQVDWLDARAASRSAAALAQAEEAIEWGVGRAASERCQFGDQQAILKPLFLPDEILRRLVERCLRHVDPAIHVRGPELTQFVRSMLDLGPATLGGVRCSIAFIGGRDVQHAAWAFQPCPPRMTG